MTFRLRPLAAAAALLAAATMSAHAQDINLQIVPKIGVYTPLNSLADDAEAELGLALGVAGELLLPGLPFNVRVNVDHATGASVITRDAAETRLGSVAITSLVGDVVLRPFSPAARLQPYLLAGGGVKFYSFDLESGDIAAAAATSRRATLHVGGGADVRFGPAALLVEIGDYISTIADAAGGTRVQNDLFGTVGFRVSMF